MKLTKDEAIKITRRNYYNNQRRKLSESARAFSHRYADDYLQQWRSPEELDAFYKDVENQQRMASALRDYYKETNNSEYDNINKFAEGYSSLLADRKAVSNLYEGFDTADDYRRMLDILAIRDDADFDTLKEYDKSKDGYYKNLISFGELLGYNRDTPHISANEAIWTSLLEYNVEAMTPEERENTVAILNKYGEDAATEYLERLDPVLAQRDAEKFYAIGQKHPLLSSVVSVPTNVLSAIEQPISMIDGSYNKFSNITTSLRGGVSSDMSGFESFLYNTGMSGADSIVAGLMPGYMGEVMLGLSAAASTQNDILRRGGTQGQAVLGGVAAGIAEAAFEHIPLDKLRKMSAKNIRTTFKAFLGNLAENIGTNALEEMGTEITNILSDAIIMGELSNINLTIDKYVASGMSEVKAYLKAFVDFGIQVAEAGASGAVMGGFLGGAGAAISTAGNYFTGNSIVKDQQRYDKLIEIGDMLSQDVDNKKTAEARELFSAIKNYQPSSNNGTAVGKISGKLKDMGHKADVGTFVNMLNTKDVQVSFKTLSEKSKANIPQTVTTAENAAKTANVSTADADIRKSNAPKIVSADGQNLSQIVVEKDGQAVTLDKLKVEDADLAMAYSYAVTTGSVETANAFMSAYALSGENVSPTSFWTAWMGIQSSGQTLSTKEENMQKVFAEYGDTLSDSAKLSAWLSGVTAKQKASERRIKAAEQARELWEKNGRKVTRGSIDASALQGVDLDSKQREFVAFGRLFAESLGMNVKFVASKKGDRGDNGSYNRKTNTITLDVFAGIGNDANYNAVQSALANTLSHEVVHNMRIVAPKEYDALSDYVFDTLKAQGVDIEERIQYQIEQSKDKKLSREDAIEEIVAHACDGMLKTSETVREFMEGFYAKDRRAARRFEQKVREIIKRLKEVFDTLLGTKAYSEEARTLYKAGSERVAEIQKLFDKGVLAMREGNLARNYEVQGLVAPGVTITPDNTIVLQQRQYRETGRASVLDYLTEQYGKDTAEDMISTMDRLYEVVDQIKDENPELNIFSQWQETEVELDDEGHPIFSSNIKNGDYPLNQDFSRVCKKRRQLDEVLNWLASNDDFTVAYLTKDDYKKINDIIKNHGFEVACDLCFVDAKRFRQSEWAESFAETWNDLLKSVMVSGNATTFNFATDSMDIAPTDVVIDPSRPISYRKWSEGKVTETRSYKNLDDFLKNDRNTNVKNMMKLIVQNEDMRHTFRAADVISSKGFDSIQRNAPQIRQILNGWGGSSAPKSSSLDAVYDNSILNIGGYNQEAAYAVGGVRMNSFSDFIAHMFFDYCQAFADLDAKKLPMQAYSKELTFFLLFGRTGGKLNMSGIPAARTPSNGKYTKLEIEKRFAGLDIEPLARYLGKPVNKLTVADCLEHLDMLDYLWAKESIDIKKATLLQSGIRFDKLSNDKIDKCYDLIKKKKFDEAHSVAGRENVDLEYTKNVGIIAVGVSEPHIRKLLRDHTIRMVIPYHKSGLNPVIAKALHIHTYMDYTNTQSTKIQYKGEAARNLNKDDHIVPFSFYDYFGKTIDGVFYDAKATANRYIQWCREMSTDEYTIIPKFNEFTNEENYYKLLEDFDCYNTITELHEAQNAVNFFGDTFPADYKSIITKELKAEQKTRDDFRTELDSTGMRQEILDVVRKRGFKGEAEEMRQARKSMTAEEKTAGDSSDEEYDYFKSFSEQIDDYIHGTFPERNSLLVGKTPRLWIDVGFNPLPVTINQKHVDYAINGTKDTDHYIGKYALKKIPKALSNPIAIIQSQSKDHRDRVVVILKIKNNDINVICAVEVDGVGWLNKKMVDSNEIVSTYAKKNAIDQLHSAVLNTIKGETELFYWNKKEALYLLNDGGLQLPTIFQISDGFVHSIHDNGSNVNTKLKNILESRQFIRWFGDWTNPKKPSSKIVDNNGIPMVVYHGTNADFSIFDIDKSSNTTKRYIDGFYFTTEEKVAQKIANLVSRTRGGKANVLAVYLDVKKPLVLTAEEYQKIGFDTKWRDQVLDKLVKGKYDGVIIKPENERVAGVFADSYNYDADANVYYNADKYGITDKDYAWWLNRAVSNPDFTATQIAVFKPEQVKSATDNIGTYDKENADMLHQNRIETPDPSTILKEVIHSKVGLKQYGKYTESLKKYQDLDVRVRNQEKRISEIDAEIKKLKHERKQSGKGARMDELYRMRKTAEGKVTEYRNRMFALESKELSGIVRAETEKARQTVQREARERYHKSVVSRHNTERRNRLRKIVNELNTLFAKGNKKKNVKSGLSDTVEKALNLSQLLVYADMGNEEVILAGLMTSQTDAEQKVIDKYKAAIEEKERLDAELDELREQEGSDNEAKVKELRNKINKLNAEKREYANTLRDLLEREKRILSKMKIGSIVDELAKAYSDLQNAEESFIRQAYSEATEDRIKKLAQDLETVYLKDMTENQLDEIVEVYKAVLKTVKEANKAFISEKGETYTMLAENTKAEIMQRGKAKDKENLLSPHARKFMLSNAIPVWFFDNLRSNTLIRLFTNLANAEDDWAVLIKDGRQYKKDVNKKYDVKKWDLDKTFSFTLRSGKKVEITLSHLFSLYAYAKQGDEAKNHLFNGGFVYAKSIILQDATKKHKKYIVRQGSTFRLDETVLAEMFATMEKAAPGASKYIDEMVAYLSGDLAQKGNDTAEKLYGIRLFNKSYYFPITSSADFIRSKEQKSAGQTPRLKNWGATNERVPGANNPIVLNSFEDIWAKHVSQMASFASFTLPLEDMERVITYSTRADDKNDAESVKGVISTILGGEYVEYIDRLIDDLNGGARVDDVTGFMNTFMRLAKTGATAMSMSTLVQQPTSMFRAMAFIDPKYFVLSRAKLRGHKEEWAELQKYAPVAIIKEIGGYDTGIGAKTAQYLKSPEYDTLGEKAIALIKDSSYRNEVIFKAPALADEITWCYIWAAVKKEVAATNKALQVDSEAYYKACGERFEYVIRRTQVYDSVLARSPIMRSKNSVAKMVTSYASEPTVFINMGYGAVDAVQHKEFKKATRILVSSLASIITNAIVSSFVYAARDDDEDETYIEKYIQSFNTEMIEGLNPITYIPFLRDIWSIMLGYDIERLDVSVIAAIWHAFEGIFSSRKTPLERISTFLGKLSTIFGVPLNNLIREGRATINLFKLMVEYFENGELADIDGILDALQESGKDSIPLLDKFI